MKRYICLLLVMIFCVCLFAGCGEKKNETSAPREMNVVLDWYPNALHAFIYTAIERGYYAEEGLDVKIQFPANENDALSLVAAGKAEIGLYYEHDIIQAVDLKTPEALKAFCRGIQAAAPVDSFVTPEPWDMPGYSDPVIMAAGAFVSGASIELSADGPMRPPYTAFFQGGLTYAHAKAGILMALQKMTEASPDLFSTLL